MTLDRGQPLSIPESIGPADHQAITSKVENLLSRASTVLPDWSPPPFDPQLLAQGLGIPIHYTSNLGGPDALIVYKQGTFHILADARVRNLGRLNFTLAHEIAHTFFEGAADKIHLRSEDRSVYDRSPEGRTLERLCDFAAAELLMPGAYFDREAEGFGFNAGAVGALASRFHVSLQAAAIRMLRSSTDRSAAVGFFDYGLPPSGGDAGGATAYRARRVFHGNDFPFLFPRGKSVPQDSVIYRCSLARSEGALEATEWFTLGSTRRLLKVSALPLRRRTVGGEPPVVCATFQLVDARSV